MAELLWSVPKEKIGLKSSISIWLVLKGTGYKWRRAESNQMILVEHMRKKIPVSSENKIVRTGRNFVSLTCWCLVYKKLLDIQFKRRASNYSFWVRKRFHLKCQPCWRTSMNRRKWIKDCRTLNGIAVDNSTFYCVLLFLCLITRAVKTTSNSHAQYTHNLPSKWWYFSRAYKDYLIYLG